MRRLGFVCSVYRVCNGDKACVYIYNIYTFIYNVSGGLQCRSFVVLGSLGDCPDFVAEIGEIFDCHMFPQSRVRI